MGGSAQLHRVGLGGCDVNYFLVYLEWAKEAGKRAGEILVTFWGSVSRERARKRATRPTILIHLNEIKRNVEVWKKNGDDDQLESTFYNLCQLAKIHDFNQEADLARCFSGISGGGWAERVHNESAFLLSCPVGEHTFTELFPPVEFVVNAFEFTIGNVSIHLSGWDVGVAKHHLHRA